MLVTLAASLLSSNEQIVAAPSLRIAALRGNGALGGPLLSAGSEKVVRNAMVDPHVAAEVELEITVGGGDGWAEGVGQLGHPATTALLHSLKSLQGEEQGWNAVVSPLLGGANVSAPVNGTVRLRLPQLCSTCDTYSIEAPCVSWPRPLELLVYIYIILLGFSSLLLTQRSRPAESQGDDPAGHPFGGTAVGLADCSRWPGHHQRFRGPGGAWWVAFAWGDGDGACRHGAAHARAAAGWRRLGAANGLARFRTDGRAACWPAVDGIAAEWVGQRRAARSGKGSEREAR